MTVETTQGLKDAISPTFGKYEVRHVIILDEATLQMVGIRIEYVFPS